MFPTLAPYLVPIWGPFRLLESYLVLIGLGTTLAGLVVWYLLPRLSYLLPTDRGKAHVQGATVAKGKPTGAGVLIVLLLVPVLLLVLPFVTRLWQVVGCLFLAMLTGYFDDRAETPWSEMRKGLLDLGVAVVASLALCGGKPVTLWLPLIKGDCIVEPVLFVPAATVLLCLTINATNCTDGVDGLAGTLTTLALFYLGGFLYLVIGHVDVSAYLLIPHNPEGARWAVLVFSAAGALAGYLWHNAEPSSMLMGDAGSRFLGLLIGVAVLESGNPLLVLVVAPVILVNGGAGLVKLVLLRGLKRLGVDVRSPGQIAKDAENGGPTPEKTRQIAFVRALHRVRFPLHDHCRRNLKWTNAQVLLRFVILQAFLTPLLLVILVKIR